MDENAEPVDMERIPAVSCSGCGFHWNSAAMAEGLRLLGSCPKCGGDLVFNGATAAAPRVERRARPSAAPHLVLGIPRR